MSLRSGWLARRIDRGFESEEFPEESAISGARRKFLSWTIDFVIAGDVN